MIIKENVRGLDYLSLALLTFGVLCLELVLFTIEPFIYGQPVAFENWTVLVHWSLTYLIWGLAIFFILKYANKKFGFKIKENSCKVKPWQWISVALIVAVQVFISYITWDGFKLQKEFLNLGVTKFIFQYSYYFVETILFTLIIIFGQKAFEKWFKRENIPYGGIICALTWGLAHIYTKSSLEVGILTTIVGFGFGAVYLLLNRDFAKTFPVVFLMFVL